MIYVKELLRRQRQAIAGATEHPIMMRGSPFYLLEGEGFFELPVLPASEHCQAIFQMNGLVGAVLMICASIVLDTLKVMPYHFVWGGLFPIGIALLWWVWIFRRPVSRNIAHMFLRVISHSEARRAAALSGLMGSLSASRALSVGKATFRALPMDMLTVADLQDSARPGVHRCPTGLMLQHSTPQPAQPGAGPSIQHGLSAQTVKVAFGDADAFLCHSWHDNAERKFEALSAWAEVFQAQENGRVPTLWFDRACVDASNVALSVACLPIYLSGCRRLVALAGPTFVTRLVK